jgi:nitroreductase
MLREQMIRRLSVRKYKDQTFNQDVTNQIQKLLDSSEPLFKDATYQLNFVTDGQTFQKLLGGIIGSYGKVRAPHYLVASIVKDELNQLNIGYVLESLVLQLTKMNIGTCWIGGGIKQDLFKGFFHLDDQLTPVIVIALGYPDSSINFRTRIKDIKRKPIEELIIGALNDEQREVMEYVRIAPSAVNLQPWRYQFENDLVHVYRVKHNFILKKLVEDQNTIDLGISICHFINCIERPVEIVFYKKTHPLNLIYVCTIKC